MKQWSQSAILYIILISIQPFMVVGSRTCIPSDDCASIYVSDDCDDNCKRTSRVSTFFRPRPITSNLTYRNNARFYERYHRLGNEFFTFSSTFLYQANRHGPKIGQGFFGHNPLLVAEEDGNINAANLSLGSKQPEGFISQVRLSPKRKIFGWIAHFNFNLDCLCTGLWFDAAFTVVNARHRICLDEKITTPGDIKGFPSVTAAFNTLGVFGEKRRHNGVDDIELRLGYDYAYCNNDHVGVYFLGSIPTGTRFDNARWFQPIVGSKNGGIGCGFSADYSFWENENLVLMTEFKYLHLFRKTEKRIFDLTNGPLSRFLLVTEEDKRFRPVSGTTFLDACVNIKPQNTIDWWLALHYEWCNWGFEGAYNLFWRDHECISRRSFNFENVGIFDKTRCEGLTSHSPAKISDNFGEGTPDALFTPLVSTDVKLSSAAAQRALSHTLSGTISYNGHWCCCNKCTCSECNCLPWTISFGALYEFACRCAKARNATLENWGVFGTFSVHI